MSKDLQPVPLTLTEYLVYTLGTILEVNWRLTSVLLFLHPQTLAADCRGLTEPSLWPLRAQSPESGNESHLGCYRAL